MECHIVYAKTRAEADIIAVYFNHQGIPTEVKKDNIFGYTILTNKEHQFKAQLIYLSRLNAK